jgi:hypothetical protein
MAAYAALWQKVTIMKTPRMLSYVYISALVLSATGLAVTLFGALCIEAPPVRYFISDLADRKTLAEIRVWETVPVSPGIPPQLIETLGKSDDVFVSIAARGLAKRILPMRKYPPLPLIKVSVHELGLPHGASVRMILARAKKVGLHLVPPELGPQLRLIYRNQPVHERLAIGMEPIADAQGNANVFYLENLNDTKVLDVGDGQTHNDWVPDFEWLFARS